ncbi:MAG TPA: class I SAM-dependent methyltransferase [Solirubrobacteraceae bacterium]|jgi:SAM-dependent methyltransferase|nr:class I SAM-dependent methyltransferase [Solirubrobacteraceae bacterium]
MAQTTTGIRSVLSQPAVYDLWSRLVGGRRAQTLIARDHICASPGARLLDLGCGTGELLEFLDDVAYVGVDLSEDYVARARESFGDRAKFYVGDVTSFEPPEASFDLAVAIGVLHHLGDASARRLLATAARSLRPSGRMVTVDPTFVERQNPLARFVIEHDRGEDVRDPEGYAALAAGAFATVRCSTRIDLVRIPYVHCVLECELASNGQA